MATPPPCHLCSSPSSAFYLKAKQKYTCCPTHIPDLLTHGVALYPISAMCFISSPSDFPVYECRREEAARLRAYLRILIASADEEKRLSFETIEKAKNDVISAISAVFSEAEDSLTDRHSDLTSQFQTLEAGIEAYLTKKDCVLPEAARLLAKADTVLIPSFLSVTVTAPLVSIANEVARGVCVASEPLERVFQVFDRKRPIWNLVSPAHKIASVRFRYTSEAQQSSFCKQVGLRDSDGLSPVKLPSSSHTPSSDREALIYRFRKVWSLEEVIQLGQELCEQGRVKMWNEEYEEARKVTEKAISVFAVRTPGRREAAGAYLQLGRICHVGLLQLDDAQKLYQRAFLICKEYHPTSDLMVESYASLAGLFASKGQPADGELQLATGLALALQSHQNSLTLGKVYRAYGYLKRQMGDFQSSLICDEKALVICEEADKRSWDVLLSYISVGCDYRDLSQTSSAEQAFLLAASFTPSCSYSIRALLHLGKMYLKSQRLEEAEEVLRRGAVVGKAMFPRSKSTLQVTEELAKLDEKRRRGSIATRRSSTASNV